jgi:hypothetical protein
MAIASPELAAHAPWRFRENTLKKAKTFTHTVLTAARRTA